MNNRWDYFDRIYILTVEKIKTLKPLLNNFKKVGIKGVEIKKFDRVGEINAETDVSFSDILKIKGCGSICTDLSKHYHAILSEAYSKGYQKIVIFEDDAKFDLPFNKLKFDRIILWLEKNYWEMFFFGSICYPNIFNLPVNRDIAWSNRPLELHAAAYSRNAMKKILSSSCMHTEHIDYYFAKLLKYQYVAYPSLCFQNREPGMYKSFKKKLCVDLDFDKVNRTFDHVSFWLLPLLITLLIIFC